VKLGDYIDLASLTVGGKTVRNDSQTFMDGSGPLRLIIVGVNSFSKTNPGAPAHVVMQFRNDPFYHKMNWTDNNRGGYKKSRMRSYLIDDFLEGLEAAGLPDSVLWSPRRFVGNGKGGVDTLTDKLWLPTEREVFGPVDADGHFTRTEFYGPYSNSAETADNQTWLEYYSSDDARWKSRESSNRGGGWYWLASPFAANFCDVGNYGAANYENASSVGGCAPAFCVR
jgi:hypothetical protein